MGAPLAWAEEGWELPPCDLLLDAVIGYGLRGDPRGRAREVIHYFWVPENGIKGYAVPGITHTLWINHTK